MKRIMLTKGKIVVVAFIAIALIICNKATVLAANMQYSPEFEYSSVTTEIGYSGQWAYARVTSSDYFDCNIQGRAYFNYVSGAEDYEDISATYSQYMYIEESTRCLRDVTKMYCYFDVYTNNDEVEEDIYMSIRMNN